MKSSQLFFAALLFFAPIGATRLIGEDLYFPPAGEEWEVVEAADVEWDREKLQAVLDFAEEQNSTGIVILLNGKILAEQYWELGEGAAVRLDRRFIGNNDAEQPIEDVASVQKSIAAILIGIAKSKQLLSLDDPVSQYLGEGWSRATPAQESAITVAHLLTMTSGLTTRGRYQSEPGTRWLYNTPVYAKTMDVVVAAASLDRHELTRDWLTEPLGMTDSSWVSRGTLGEQAGNAFGFATTARDLARFGLMMLADGEWEDQVIVEDKEYLESATTTSQDLNPYYGYLWWLSENANAPNRARRHVTAPADMFAAKGALNRRCYVCPSMGLVVTRLGAQPENPATFDRELWRLLMDASPQ